MKSLDDLSKAISEIICENTERRLRQLYPGIDNMLKEYQELKEKDRWISISERLPTQEDAFYRPISKEYCFSIIRNNDELDVLYVRHFDEIGDYFEDCGITHWKITKPPLGMNQ